MKTFLGRGLVVAGVLVFAGILYSIFFHVWPFYPVLHPMWGWRYHSFGLRMWPGFPLFGMLLIIVAGILIAGYLFRALSVSPGPRKGDPGSCPYCGKELNGK